MIQPAPAFDKRLTEHEKPFAPQMHHDVYEKMTDYLVDVQQTYKLPIRGLLDMFKQTDAEI